MIKTTRNWTRASIYVPWWTTILPEEYKTYVNAKYVITGKRISNKFFLSKDKLILTNEIVFSSEETLQEFSADPIVRGWLSTRKNYCSKNNIQESDRMIILET